jgi:hypothetical protein
MINTKKLTIRFMNEEVMRFKPVESEIDSFIVDVRDDCIIVRPINDNRDEKGISFIPTKNVKRLMMNEDDILEIK